MKKNPFLSLWLSSANAILATARGQVAAYTTRQRNAALRAMAKQTGDVWFGGASRSTGRKRGRRR